MLIVQHCTSRVTDKKQTTDKTRPANKDTIVLNTSRLHEKQSTRKPHRKIKIDEKGRKRRDPNMPTHAELSNTRT